MTRAAIAGGAFAVITALIVLFAVAAGYRTHEPHPRPAVPSARTAPPTAPAEETQTRRAAESHPGFLYGRITTIDRAVYEGRLRWGGREEAFWGDYFNGSKHDNPWRAQVPPAELPEESHPIEIFGIKIIDRKRPIDLRRPFMARFGEIARIEARGIKGVRVTLKSGTVFDLDRFEAGDFDDSVRVWDATRGVVDLDSLRIRSIELLPTPAPGAAPSRLHGTVRTPQGDFTGFLQWDREECVGSDTVDGHAAGGEVSLRFDTIRSIARRSPDSSLVVLLDGREIVLSDTREVGRGNRGVYVDDSRYGRVLVSWDAFERVDFSPGGSGPAYGYFPPGSPLSGSVTTRDGRRLTGRLVYDLDESETTETLDAPSQGVDYTIPFGLISSIQRPDVEERGVPSLSVTLASGEELQLEPEGDLGDRNAGMLIFLDGRQRPEYVPWTNVEGIVFDPAPAMYPPLGGREITGAR